jgi:molybdopterin-guanine dinucleotide biosynthesis protein A
MGRSKGDLVWDGGALAERATQALWPFCGSVLISIRPGSPNPVPACGAIEDGKPAGRGPLAGIDAAFAATGGADLLVLACDYPLVDSSLIRQLASLDDEGEDLVLPTDGRGRDHPLVALWRRSCQPIVHQALEEERFEVRGLFPDLEIRRLRPADLPGFDLSRTLTNVNWPADLERLRAP